MLGLPEAMDDICLQIMADESIEKTRFFVNH
jgi:hypothetical protein